MHTPVLLDQILTHVHISADTTVIDATFGEGGHTLALLRRGARVLALDADASQIESFRVKCPDIAASERLTLVCANYSDMKEVATKQGCIRADFVLFDLGLSMQQLTHGEGFSYKFPLQPLNLVIDSQAKQKGAARAAEVVTYYDEHELTQMFARYGELPKAAAIARAIVSYRKMKKIETVGDFREAIAPVVEDRQLAAVFQALRVEVNHEYERIIAGLDGALELIPVGGSLAVITFHSGEDRLVKLWARKQSVKEYKKIVGKDVSEHTFERSAVLRIYHRI